MLLKEILDKYIWELQCIEVVDFNNMNTLFKDFKDKITHPDYRKYLQHKIKFISAFQSILIIYIIGDDKN